MEKLPKAGGEVNSFLLLVQKKIVWLRWGKEAGRKMEARWHLTVHVFMSYSSQLYFPVGAYCGHSVVHVCFLFFLSNT